MHIALLDPFFDESHENWARGLVEYSRHSFELITLSAHHWKWRMASGALYCAQEINHSKQNFDLLLATDMVDIALLRSQLNKDYSSLPIVLYFHENQINYHQHTNQEQPASPRDHHFGWINFTSAVTADTLLFNSQYHFYSFFDALPQFISQFPKSHFIWSADQLREKSQVLYPGIEPVPSKKMKEPQNIPVIIWNHRWEKDKNPEDFFHALYHLKSQKIPFRLIVCGKRFESIPAIFDQANRDFKDEMIHFGYAHDRSEYLRLLHQADIALVTSQQDFFGISVVEAIASGCYPILPERLAYREHIPSEYRHLHMYKDNYQMHQLLADTLTQQRTVHHLITDHVKKYFWPENIHKYDLLFDTTSTNHLTH